MPLTNFYHSYSGNSIGRFLGYSSVVSGLSQISIKAFVVQTEPKILRLFLLGK